MKNRRKKNQKNKKSYVFSIYVDGEVKEELDKNCVNRSKLINNLLRHHMGLPMKKSPAPRSFYQPKD